MEHGLWLMERAESISRKFEAGIRFQKCDETGCWAGSGKGVGQMEMTRICGPPSSPWKFESAVLIFFFFPARILIFRGSKGLKKTNPCRQIAALPFN